MNKSKLFKVLALLVAASMVLAACGRGGGEATEPAGGGPKIASSGFECPEPEPRMEVTSKELNVFVWTEYFTPEMLECFELVYGVKINRDEYSSNEEMYAKLSAGGTNYDLVQPSDYMILLMVREGLIQEMDLTQLPNLKNIGKGYLDLPFDLGNKYTIPWLAGTDAIVYNSATVETPPTSWADLWNPEYAGRMVFLDDSRVTIGMTLLTLGYDFNSKNETELREAEAKLKELIPNVKIFDSDSPKTSLIAGDVDLGIVWTGEAFLAREEVSTIEYVYPSEGAILWQDNWALPVGASHLDAAYAWMNYLMQGNIMWMVLSGFPYTNPNTAALEFARTNHPDVYKAYAESPITNPPEEAIANAITIEDVGEALPLYDEIWTKVKGQ